MLHTMIDCRFDESMELLCNKSSILIPFVGNTLVWIQLFQFSSFINHKFSKLLESSFAALYNFPFCFAQIFNFLSLGKRSIIDK